MNMTLLDTFINQKDIKSFLKDIKNVKENSERDFFEDILKTLLSDIEDNKTKNFLIKKFLNSSNDLENFEKLDKMLSTFSKGELKVDDDKNLKIGEVLVEDLLKLSFMIKNDIDVKDFKTDSKELKACCQNKSIIKEFKAAKNIRDLLQIAKKYDIKVKNFQFFKEDLALDYNDKKSIQTIKSADIFELIEDRLKKFDRQTFLNSLKEDNKKFHTLKSVLASVNGNKNNDKKDNLKDKSIESKDYKSKINNNDNIVISKKTKIDSQSNIKLKTQKENFAKKESVTSKNTPSKNTQNIKILDIDTKEKQIEPNIDKNVVKKAIQVLDKKQEKVEIKKTDTNVDTNIVNQKNIQKNKKIISKVIDNKLKDKTVDFEQKKVSKVSNNIFDFNNFNIKKKEKIKSDIELNSKKENQKSTKLLQNNQDNKELLNKSNANKNLKDLLQNHKIDKKINIKNIEENKENDKKTFIKEVEDVKDVKNKSIDEKNLKIKKDNQAKQKKVIQIQNQSQEKLKEIDIDLNNKESLSSEEKVENIHQVHTHKGINIKHNTNINNDLKRTLNYFAQDFKEKVESYKPPLMKVKMQLNPKELGEVDITMINRGNNLHITVSSNHNTIAIFSQNQNEFKNSLVNMGFNELTMNFNENGKNKDNQNGRNKNQNIKNFEETEDEDNFEIITPLYL